MIFSATISQAGYIAITLSILAGSIGLIVLLYFVTKHERKRYRESKLSDLDVRIGKLDEELKDKLTKATNKTTFDLITFSFYGADTMIARYGKAGYGAIVEVLQRRVRKALKMSMVICPHGKDRIVVITDQSIPSKKLLPILSKCQLSFNQDITMADSSLINVIGTISVAQYPSDAKELMELLNVMDKAHAMARRNGNNSIALYKDNTIDIESYESYSKLAAAIANKNLTVSYRKVVGGDGKITAIDTVFEFNNSVNLKDASDSSIDYKDVMWIEQIALYKITAKVNKINAISNQALTFINPNFVVLNNDNYKLAMINAIKLSGNNADKYLVVLNKSLFDNDETLRQVMQSYKAVGVSIVLSNVDVAVEANMLKQMGADYLIINGKSAADAGEAALIYIQSLKTEGLKVIADNVAIQNEREKLFAMGVDMIMGRYVGEYGKINALEV